MTPETTSKMTGRVCLVTGASSGIGFETAKSLAQQGATVVTVSRGGGDGAQKAEQVRRETGSDAVTFVPADLSSLQDIRRLAEEFKAQFETLDVLVNNAGLFAPERKTTADGYELTFALNHLAYFLLTNLLLERLLDSAPARIVNVSSEAERFGKIHFDDPMLSANYNGWKAYGQSKLANLLFTFELAKRLAGTGVTVNALHPGAVATGFGQGAPGLISKAFGLFRPLLRSPEKGAETAIFLASSPAVAGVTGKYFKDKEPIAASKAAQNTAAQTRLWRLSEELTNLSDAENPFAKVVVA